MIMAHIQGRPGHCPRPDCVGAGIKKCCSSTQLTWYDAYLLDFRNANVYSGTCYLKFFPSSDTLEDSFNRVVVTEDDVARLQAEEDLRLYGDRPEPGDVVEVDEDTHLSGLPPKRTASEFEAAVDRPAKVRKKGESKEFNYQAVTAMDWNSGASPLEAWLNESAIPSSASVNINEKQATDPPDKNPIAQEEEEIKVFRNVHIGMSKDCQVARADTADVSSSLLELEAQIFCRNITDRYPLLPMYLARRLAQANHDRAERLRLRRLRAREASQDLTGAVDRLASDDHGNGASSVPMDSYNLEAADNGFATERSQPNRQSTGAVQRNIRCLYTGCNMSFSALSLLKRHQQSRELSWYPLICLIG